MKHSMTSARISCSVLVLAWLGGALGCSSATEPTTPTAATGPDVNELFTPGPHAVGFVELEMTYTAPASTDDRTLPVKVWYPAVDGGEGPAQYAVAGIVSLPATGALAAPAIADGGPFPVALYSHGFGGEGLIAYPYGEMFASHGWVVVAPNHTGNTALDGLNMTTDSTARIALNRPHDIGALLDWLASGSAAAPLDGQTVTDRVFMFGHSFGAYTTLAAAGADLDIVKLAAGCTSDCADWADNPIKQAYSEGFGDDRIVAIAPQAPAFIPNFADGELAALGQPTMLMSGRMDITTTHSEQAEPAWAGLDNPADLWVQLPLGGHLSFITVCDDLEPAILDVFQPQAADDGCGPAFTPVSETIPALGAYLLGFARAHLLGETQWLEPLGTALDPAFEVSTH
jgi:predicted dienelactone hydrolase